MKSMYEARNQAFSLNGIIIPLWDTGSLSLTIVPPVE